MKKLLAEFIGTFFLVFVIALSGDPLAIGVILMIMVYTLGPISGGHFNPAVTIGIFLSKKMDSKTAIKYIVTQFLGSFVASIAYVLITGNYFSPSISDSSKLMGAYAIEMIFTFALVFVVLNVATNEKVKNNQYFGLAIGLTIFVGATAGAAISGGVFNPAVGVAPLLLHFSAIGSNITNIVLYILGPIAGAVLAAYVYKVMNENTVEV